MVLRALSIAVLCAVAFQATGIGYAAAAQCRDGCGDDDVSGRCPPACVCCSCCVHAMPSTVAVVATFVAPPPTRELEAPDVVLFDSSPDPAEIFHIPKHPLV